MLIMTWETEIKHFRRHVKPANIFQKITKIQSSRNKIESTIE